jgi:hypothetical protein
LNVIGDPGILGDQTCEHGPAFLIAVAYDCSALGYLFYEAEHIAPFPSLEHDGEFGIISFYYLVVVHPFEVEAVEVPVADLDLSPVN